MIKSVFITNETKVQSGLSLSPAEINRMTLNGRAAALGSNENNAYYDNLPAGAAVPMENRRGTDINVMWREMKNAQDKIVSARGKALKEVSPEKLN